MTATTRLITALAAAALLFGACSNDDPDDPTDTAAADDTAAFVDTSVGEDTGTPADTSAGGDTDGGAVEAGAQVAFSIHNATGQQCIDLAEMTAKDDTSGYYDLLVSKSGAGPVILLGADVEAINLGHDRAFDEVDELPADGYAPDEGGDLVIGKSWRTGGAGRTGFTMSNDVYAIKRPDGTYAKAQVLSAKAGVITVVCYYQPDGTRSVATADSL